MDARILNITPEQYHADPCDVPSLSTSIAHTLIAKSPAHAYSIHPRLGGQPSESTAATDNGSVIHRLILGKGQDIAVIAGNDFRSKAAQEERDAAIAAGQIPMIESKYQEIVTVADIIKRKLWDNHGIAFTGESEVCIEFDETGYDGPVRCRTMIDHLYLDEGVQYELKTIRSADLRTCGRHSYFYGYDLGHAARVSALTKLKPELAGRDDFIFLFCETVPPYAVTPLRPDGGFKTLGEERWLHAIRLWEQCMTNNKWPEYVSGIGTLEAPHWALAEMEAGYGDSV